MIIRPARPSDLRHVADVEDSGGPMFVEHLGDRLVPALLSAAPSGAERDLEGTLLVAVDGGDGGDGGTDGKVAGFAHLVDTDDAYWGHLEQLSVRPEHQRRGLGAALVRAVLDEAHWAGRRRVSLCTYRDVPWNGPFYRGLGFEPVERLEPYQQRLRAHEVDLGLDEAGARLVMARDV